MRYWVRDEAARELDKARSLGDPVRADGKTGLATGEQKFAAYLENPGQSLR